VEFCFHFILFPISSEIYLSKASSSQYSTAVYIESNPTMAAEVTVGVWLVAIYLLIPVFLYVFAPQGPSTEDLNRRARAIVLVLGDLGRSPRMMYHARSLARGNVEVNLCGYDGMFFFLLFF